ncbi:unnamed protein product [Lactuca saligna]|uniref:Uncharacterized protein n=1 Tax=Lactuca saligna TaxID=75948 RepID=A0AA35YVU1_LACSI|nr:unnamed protein product [Lactuca saligna]
METNSIGDTSTQPKEFENFCIRQYVAEVRRKDWKKCCPFDLSSYSPESNYQAERVFASLINDALINIPENTQATNSLIYFEVRNPDGQAAVSETHAGVVIGNDTTSIINDTPLESASGKVTYAHCENEKVIYGDMVAAENGKPEDAVVVDDSLEDIIADGASKSSSRKLKNDVQHQNDKPEDVVVVDDSQKDTNDGPSKSSSLKLKDDGQYQNENSVCEDIIAAGNEKRLVVDDDGANTNSDEERNLAGEKPRKFRLLTDIYKQLQGPCDAVSAGYSDSDFSSESEEDDSDEFTLDTFVRKKKGARVNSKTGVASKKRKRSCKERERSFVRAKRTKPVPADSCRKDSEFGSKRQLRKTRTDEEDLQVMKKHKKSSAEIILCGSTSGSQKVAPEENRLETKKDSLLSCGNKRKRQTIQDDCGRDVSKFLDRSQRRLTEENRSRSTHGVNSVQLVQPNIATLNSIETASGCVEKSIRENSPPADNESMAALLLLSLFNSGVTTHTSSKAAAKDAAVSVSNGEISSGIDEKVLHASRSIVDQSREEFNIINGIGLPQAEQVESGTSVCIMNANQSEFSILNAKKYMRRAKVIRK